MKHKILVLGVMMASLLGLTACGSDTTNYNTVEGSRYHSELFKTENIVEYAKYVENDAFEKWFLSGVTPENFEEKAYFESF